MGIPDMPEMRRRSAGQAHHIVRNLKKAVLGPCGGAMLKLGLGWARSRGWNTLMHIADMVIDTYLAESVVLRTRSSRP
ncbi:MAG: hypothetical protein R2810_06500 [Flavobacteriales bacterium]